MFDKDGCFNIELATDDDVKKIIGISKWLERRMDDIPGELQDNYFNDDGSLYVKTYHDRYCMGCHMETTRRKYTIPREIFFSNDSLGLWINKQDELERKRLDAERKRFDVAYKREAAKRKEKRDAADYKRLKAKFEGTE